MVAEAFLQPADQMPRLPASARLCCLQALVDEPCHHARAANEPRSMQVWPGGLIRERRHWRLAHLWTTGCCIRTGRPVRR